MRVDVEQQCPDAVDVGDVARVEHDVGRAVLGRTVGAQHERVHLQPVRDQAVGEVAAVLTRYARDERPLHQPAFWASTSASTIIATSSAKLIRGAHPSAALALEASPMSWSTSAGRMKRSSWRT